ncbi:Arginase/agmatinase/formimionoglutamate hydrolase [Microbacterium esteraromaticum]|uniref:Arginase/agmatinase/formimionoglutamate hydrolase n=1 Tax=Microbacterium esteraromaticum TaxID=57043 RepID=A0A1R4KS92_9MICO|nr:Arginase/agmatinase/formimionoglutamate hydrolase [Microbacterium esteraromaticum]
MCRDDAEVQLVKRLLAQHITLTRSESGCAAFDVVQTSDPLVWQVDELFVDEVSFRAHQERAARSEWGIATRAVERRFSIEGLSE